MQIRIIFCVFNAYYLLKDFIMYADQSGQERGLFELRRFASRNKGLFIPAVDGNYKFSVIADDLIEFRFNPQGSDPAGAVGIKVLKIFNTR